MHLTHGALDSRLHKGDWLREWDLLKSTGAKTGHTRYCKTVSQFNLLNAIILGEYLQSLVNYYYLESYSPKKQNQKYYFSFKAAIAGSNPLSGAVIASLLLLNRSASRDKVFPELRLFINFASSRAIIKHARSLHVSYW